MCFPSARIDQLWLAAAPVKAPDELAALGLDRRLASRKSPHIRAKKNIRYELTQSQIALDIDRPSHGRPTHSFSFDIGKLKAPTTQSRGNRIGNELRRCLWV